MRLEEKSRSKESWQGEEVPWPREFCLGRVAMGRSFESVRMGAREVSARWLKASRALKEGRPDLRAEAGGDGEETLQRGIEQRRTHAIRKTNFKY